MEKVREAYKDLVNVWHPDRFAHDPRLQKKAQEELKKINDAYEHLHAPPRPPEKPGPTDHPTSPPDTAGSPHISAWMWPLIVAVVILAVYESTVRKSQFNPAVKVPVEPLPVARPQEKPNRPPFLKTQGESSPLTPEKILTRKRKETERWGSRTYGSKNSKPPSEPRTGNGPPYITVGSTKEDVIRFQGTPDSSSANLFTYGQSNIYFEDDKVTGWDNRTPRLNVRLKPASRTGATSFTVGSTKDDVLSVQGTPDSLTDNEFIYGSSSVHFGNDRVTSWYDHDARLKVRMQPHQD